MLATYGSRVRRQQSKAAGLGHVDEIRGGEFGRTVALSVPVAIAANTGTKGAQSEQSVFARS